MTDSWLESYCGSSTIWDSETLQNTSIPFEFPSCFQHTLLVWIPLAFITICTPLVILTFNKFLTKGYTNPRKYNVSWLTILKILLTICVVTTEVVVIVLRVSNDLDVYTADIVTPSLYVAANIISLIVLYWTWRTDQKRSGVLWAFWLLLAVGAVLVAINDGFIAYPSGGYIQSASMTQSQAQTQFTLSTIYAALCIVSLILSSFGEPYDLKDKENPEYYAGWFSVLMFFWFSKIIRLGHRQALTEDDLWKLNPNDRAVRSGQKLMDNYKVKKTLFKSMLATYGPLFLTACFFKLGNDFLQFVPVILLNKMIAFVTSTEPDWYGYFYAISMYISAIATTLFLHQYFHRVFRVGMLMRSGLITMIYRKAMRLSSDSLNNRTVGEMITLMSSDAQRLMDTVTYLAQLWSSPLQIVICMVGLYNQLGWASFVGLATTVVMIPLNLKLTQLLRNITIDNMKNRTQRIKKTNEMLNGMKVMKLYSWEDTFRDQIEGLRAIELFNLWRAGKIGSLFSLLWGCAPFFVSIAAFGAYAFSGAPGEHILTSERVFVSLSLFNILRFPLNILPSLMVGLVQANVSLVRIESFLTASEVRPNDVEKDSSKTKDSSGNAVVMEKATFSWEQRKEDKEKREKIKEKEDKKAAKKNAKKSKQTGTAGKGQVNPAFDNDGGIKMKKKEESVAFSIDNLNWNVKEGELVAVIGAVGSGKSSLIQSLIGDLDKTSGKCAVYGRIAYVPQQAWIMNVTLKDNILFGKEYDEEQYKRTIQVCALGPDLDMLPAGDQTEIGEKGINLSGGQRQRVALARAVYSQADTYIFDDPLSAVDSHVGKHIFEKLLSNETGLVKGKTRILVTNAMQYVSSCDTVVIMDTKDSIGYIAHQGKYQALTNDAAASEYFKKFGVGEGDDDGSEEGPTKKVPEWKKQQSELLKKQKSEKDGALTKKEVAAEGNVAFSVLWTYAKNIGLLNFTIMVLTNMIYVGCNTVNKWWLSEWSNDCDQAEAKGTYLSGSDNLYYLGIYGGIGITQCLFVLLRTLALYHGCICAGRALHTLLISRIVRVPLSFFDTTPLGRIVNRFSKDISILDDVLPRSINFWFAGIFDVLATISIITYATPWFIAVVVPLLVVYLFIQRYYVATSRQLKRLEGVTRSPIYNHFGESVSGVSSIRAFERIDDFVYQNESNIDRNQRCYYPNVTSNRWLAVRLELIANTLVAFAGIFATLSRHSLDAAVVGLSISYAMSITQTLNWWVRQTAEIETNIVAVERIMEYANEKEEAPAKATDENKLKVVEKEWPGEGRLAFKKYATRYRPGLDLVIKNIDLEIQPGQTVGIVGRTGAGKSSLTLALFRIIEAAEGSIVIDGVDISKLGLKDLRSRLTIIPQDPVLWTGTLRDNLDPLNETNSDDSLLWRALELAQLKELIVSKNEGLDFKVQDGGENFSVGQRQLLCLARALLRKSKILVLDEATAAVDPATDQLIQDIIRREFKGWTVLTIAHRLNTIIDYDRILVLDRGEVKEFDTPKSLLAQEDSIFTSMCQQAGITLNSLEKM